MQNFSWTIRVISSPDKTVTAQVGKEQFKVQDAIHFDSEHQGVSALEYVLGATGADIVACLKSLAKKKRIALDSVEAKVIGELNNPLVHLGVIGEEGDPGIKKIQVKVYMSSSNAKQELEALWAEALTRSPLANTFRRLIEFEVNFKIVL